MVLNTLLSIFIVTAAHHWDDEPDLMTIKAPIQGSLEELMDRSTAGDAFVITHSVQDAGNGRTKKFAESYELIECVPDKRLSWTTYSSRRRYLNRPRYQRFIGVIYRPDTELRSHYSKCAAADQYNAIAIVKSSRGIRALEPEDHRQSINGGDLDETFPFGY